MQSLTNLFKARAFVTEMQCMNGKNQRVDQAFDDTKTYVGRDIGIDADTVFRYGHFYGNVPKDQEPPQNPGFIKEYPKSWVELSTPSGIVTVLLKETPNEFEEKLDNAEENRIAKLKEVKLMPVR